MKNNKLTIFLLAALVLSVWTAIVLFAPKLTTTAEAQAKRQYGLAAVDKTNRLVYDGAGATVISASNLQQVLLEAPKDGWRIHTVTAYNSGTINGFVVVLEK
jgi:hypothetical protein